MIVLGLAGLALFIVMKASKKTTGTSSAASKPAGWVDQIFDAGGSKFANGWSYYTDGTAIDPSGNYYKDGSMIWQANGA